MRRAATLGLPAGCAVLGLTGAATAPAAPAARVSCPLRASGGQAGAVQWSFSDTSPALGAAHGTNAYTHGRGTWRGGHAGGTVCLSESGPESTKRDLVLSAAGAAKLSTGVTRLGLPGVELALEVKVAASDDAACAPASPGRLTLFASYHEAHRDSAVLRFRSGCTDHDLRYGASNLHVLITRGGAQVGG